MRVVKLKKVKRINSLHYAPDGRLLVVGGVKSRDVDEAVWVDLLAGEEVSRITLEADCYAVTADLSKMAIGSREMLGNDEPESQVVWFDPRVNEKLHAVHVAESVWEQTINCLAFDPGGQLLLMSYVIVRQDWKRRLEMLTLATVGDGLCERVELVIPRGIEYDRLAFRPDGTHIVASGSITSGSYVIGHDSHTLQYLEPTCEFTPESKTRQLLYSPSGDWLAVVNDLYVYLLPTDSSEPRLSFVHPKQVNAVAFSPDGRHLVSACRDKQVRVWDVKTGKLFRGYDWKVGPVTALTFAPDGLTVAAGGEKGQIVVWDWE